MVDASRGAVSVSASAILRVVMCVDERRSAKRMRRGLVTVYLLGRGCGAFF